MLEQIKLELSEVGFFNESKIMDHIQSCFMDASLYTNTFSDFFISDYLMGKDREAKSFFLFTLSTIFVFPKLLQQEELQVFSFLNSIHSLEIRKKSLEDPAAPTHKSRYSATVYLHGNKSFEMKSSGKNCSKAFRIVNQYFFPNLT